MSIWLTHLNALWAFLMPFTRFFDHYAGQFYKVEEELPPIRAIRDRNLCA